MKAQIDGNEYTIEFAYYTSTADAGHAHDAEITVCIIRDGSAPREPKTLAPRLASGEAVRYFRDSPNREIGRKAALEKALDALLGGPNLEGMRACATTPIKTVRRAFWKLYAALAMAQAFICENPKLYDKLTIADGHRITDALANARGCY